MINSILIQWPYFIANNFNILLNFLQTILQIISNYELTLSQLKIIVSDVGLHMISHTSLLTLLGNLIIWNMAQKVKILCIYENLEY